MPRTDDAMFYQLYFQTPGVAEAELERDARETIAKLLFSASGDVPRRARSGGGDVGMVKRDGGFLTQMVRPAVLPAWLTDADLEFYAGEFTRSGFRGGLSWYRNIDRNWELLAPFAGAKVSPGALYCRRPRSGGRLSEHGPGDCQFGRQRAAIAWHHHATGLRSLDPAGARF
jgi:hypothetical protein